MPNWKKLIVSGSDANLNSLNITTDLTGSNALITNELDVQGSIAIGSSPPSTAALGVDGNIKGTGYLLLNDSNNQYIYASPTGRNVEIYASSSISSGDPAFRIRQDNAAKVDFGWDDDGTSEAFIWNYSNGGFKIGTNGSERFKITSDGKVGIGTTSPSQKLEVAGNIKLGDSNKLILGAGDDLQIYHDGINSKIDNTTGKIVIENFQDDGDIIFKSDDGSGGTTEYFRLDGGNTQVKFYKNTNYIDNINASFGNSGDLKISHNGTHSSIENETGNLYIINDANDGDIIFQSDDGSGGVTEYFRLDGSNSSNNYVYTNFPDKSVIQFGDSNDLQIFHDSADSTITNHTGNLYIQNRADDKDIILRTDNGSGNYTEYLVLDGSTTHAYFSNPGNVGIGTTSPDYELHVQGEAIYLAGASNQSQLLLTRIGQVNKEGAYIASNTSRQLDLGIWDNNSTPAGIKISAQNNVISNSSLEFITGGASRINVNGAGNVGIGTSSPAFKLDVDGTVGVTGLETSTSTMSLMANETLSSELTTNGSFATTSNWTAQLSVNFTVSGGDATIISAGANSLIYQNISPSSANAILKITVNVVSFTGSSFGINFGGYAKTVTETGTFTFYTTSSRTNSKLDINPSTNQTLVISDISVKEVISDQIAKRELGTGAFGPTPVGAYLPLAGGTMTGDLHFNDGVEARFGDSNDLTIQSVGDQGYIQNYTGDLNIVQNADNSDIVFKSDNASGGTTEYFRVDGGITKTVFTRDTKHLDTKKALFGDQDDLQIYHDGSNSYIKDTGTGNLRVRSTSLRLEGTDSSNMLVGNEGDSVSLYFNNSKKFETSNTGATLTGDLTVTGKVTAQEFHTEFVSASIMYESGSTKFGDTSDDNHDFTGSLNVLGDIESNHIYAETYRSSRTDGDIYIQAASSTDFVSIGTEGGNNNVLRVQGNGNVGIGTTGPSEKLEVVGNIKASDGTSYASITPSGMVGSLSTKSQSVQGAIVSSVSSGNTFASQDIYTGVNIGSFNGAGTVTIGAFNYGNVNYQTGHNSYTHSWYGSRANDPWLTLNATGLGIGTASPSEKLDIAGNVRVGQNNGFYINNQNVGIKRDSNDLVLGGFGNVIIKSSNTTVVNQAERMRITSAGNVGIGTTSPGEKLDVVGRVRGERFRTTTGGSASFAAYYFLGDADTGTFQPANNTFGITTAGTERMRIDSGGNVGIGTTSPGAKLDIKTSTAPFTALKVSNYGSNVNALYAGAVDDTYLFFGSGFYYNSSKFRAPSTTAAITSYDSGAFRVFTDSGLTANTDYTPSERMRITSSGNVGIGTVSPSEKLEVNGNIKFSNGALFDSQTVIGSGANDLTISTPDFLKLDPGYGDLQVTSGIAMAGGLSTGGRGRPIVFGGGEDYLLASSTDNDVLLSSWKHIRFGAGSGSGESNFSEKMRITSAGNVGIGVTSVSNKLTVYDSNQNYPLRVGNNTSNTDGSYTGMVFYNSTNVGGGSTGEGSASIRAYRYSGQGNLANELEFLIAGTPVMRFDTLGNVGIGTTSPSVPLHIKADAPTIRLEDNTSSDNHYLTGNNGELRVQSTGYITIRPNNATSTTFLANGNVGINDTSAPKKLTVNGQTQFYEYGGAHLTNLATSNFNFNTLANNSASTSGGSVGAFIKVTATPTGNTGTWSAFRARAYGENTQGNTNEMVNFFAEYRNYTSTNAVTLSHHAGLKVNPLGVGGLATVTNNYGIHINPGTAATNNYGIYQSGTGVKNFFQGKVGIGTTGPSYPLTVRSETGNVGTAFFDSVDNWERIYIGSTNEYIERKGSEQRITFAAQGSAGYFTYQTTGSEKLRIANNGNVGIGTTSTPQKLTVQGNVQLNHTSGNSQSSYDLRFNATNSSGQSQIKAAMYAAPYGNNTNGGNFVIKTANTGTTLIERFSLNAIGAARFNQYGSGTHTGTAAYTLAVDSSGNIIETTGGSGTVSSVSNGVDNRVATFSGSDSLNGEANLTFDGSTLGVTGNIAISNAIPKIILTDTDTSTTAQISANSSHLTYTTAATSRDHIFKAGTDTVMTIEGTGNVGIGTTSPSEKLEVAGDIASQGIYVDRTHEFGGISNPFAKLGLHYFWGDSNSINLQKTGNNNKFTFSTQTGYLQIVNSSGAQLQIKSSDQSVKSASGTFNLGVTQHGAANNNQGNYVSITNGGNTTGSKGVINVNGDLKINDYSTSSAIEKIKLKNDGSAYFTSNVGIGTTSPQGKLDISTASSSDIFNLRIHNLAGETSQSTGILFNTGYTDVNRGKGGLVYEYDTSAGWNRGDFHFLQRQDGASGIARLSDSVVTIKNNGNVGIGTTSPGHKLSVESSTTPLHLNRTGGATALIGLDIAGVNRGLIGATTTSAFVSYSTAAAPLMTILNTGNVGIGTTSPSEKLDVAGSVRIGNMKFEPSSAGRIGFNRNTSNGVIYNSNYPAHQFNAATSTNGFFEIQSYNATGGFQGSVVINAGNVGIGTTSPSEKLDVNGNLLTRGDIVSRDSYPSIYVDHSGTVMGGIRADATTKLELKTLTTAPLSFQVNSSEKMRITSAGNVGIGTTSPGVKLHLSTGNSSLPTLDGGTLFVVDATQGGTGNYSAMSILSGTAGVSSLYLGDPDAENRGSLRYYNSSNSISIGTNGAERMRITSDGKVGIGTTNPDQPLTVQGRIHLSGTGENVVYFDRPSNGASVGAIGWDSNTNHFYVGGHPDYGPTAGNNVRVYGFGQNLHLGNNNAGDVLTVTNAGNVGIGTTSPVSPLTVKSNSVSSGNSGLTIQANGSTDSIIKLGEKSTNGARLEMLDANVTKIALFTDGTDNYINAGNVGIGTTSPSNKLDVIGDASVTALRVGSSASGEGIVRHYSTGGQGIGIVTGALNASGIGLYVSHGNNNRNVGIGTTSPSYKLSVAGGIAAGGKVTYTKSAGSLDTTGFAVAGLTTSSNGLSAGFTFTCFGHTGGYQKIVYSCANVSGTWNTFKVIDEGTNQLDIEASTNGTTITFTFKSRSGTMYYTPRVTIEATGSAINNTYA